MSLAFKGLYGDDTAFMAGYFLHAYAVNLPTINSFMTFFYYCYSKH